MAWSKSVLVTLGLLIVLAMVLRVFVLDILWVQTMRFAPTIQRGDLVLALHISNPKRGDIVRHRCPERPLCLSEVLGLEGDRIDIEADRILVNEKAHSALLISDAPQPEPQSSVVPPGHYFVSGDMQGALAHADIVSVVERVLWRFR